MSIYYNREQRVTLVILFYTKIQDNVLALKENLIIALILRINTLHLYEVTLLSGSSILNDNLSGLIRKNFTNLLMIHDMTGTSNNPKPNQTIIYFSADNKAEHLL